MTIEKQTRPNSDKRFATQYRVNSADCRINQYLNP